MQASGRLRYVDLVLYRERGVHSRDVLLKKHAHSLGYLQHLPDAYHPIAIQRADFDDAFCDRNVRFVVIRGASFLPVPVSLVACLESLKPDVVLLHSFNHAWQLLWLKRCLPAKTRILVQNHAEQPFRNSLKLWIQRRAARRVAGFLFVSKDQAEPWIQRRIIHSRHKVFEVMEGSTSFGLKDRAQCRRRLKLLDGPIFLWVGRLDSNKDPLTILKAFHQLKRLGHSFTLYMVYNANPLEPEAARFIRENDLSADVKLVGALKHEDLEDWYNAADFFILGSHHESGGFALCEALACGCAPIVTNIPSFKTMTDNGRLGWLFEPGNVGQLAEILVRALRMSTELRRAESRNLFEQELSHEAIAEKIHQACGELLKV
jgi:glycosyltransferase involved in cell wall biosynthesis